MTILHDTLVAIVGGGVHGATLGLYLKQAGITAFTIIDQHPVMTTWFNASRAQGMRDLRTPRTEHISPLGKQEMADHIHKHSGCGCGLGRHRVSEAELKRPPTLD